MQLGGGPTDVEGRSENPPRSRRRRWPTARAWMEGAVSALMSSSRRPEGRAASRASRESRRSPQIGIQADRLPERRKVSRLAAKVAA